MVLMIGPWSRFDRRHSRQASVEVRPRKYRRELRTTTAIQVAAELNRPSRDLKAAPAKRSAYRRHLTGDRPRCSDPVDHQLWTSDRYAYHLVALRFTTCRGLG